MIDVRLPIGGLFTILGLMLVLYGIFTRTDTGMYAKSLGININFWWGLVLTVFGAAMLFFGSRSGGIIRQKTPAPQPHTADQEKTPAGSPR